MRITLVHDYLLVLRGAERTFASMADCWPGATIRTLLYDPRAMEGRFDRHGVHPSMLQRLPVHQGNFRALLPLYPVAAERLRLGEPDLIVSSSSAFAQGIQPPAGVPHITYCH